jgi:hypothetical protein
MEAKRYSKPVSQTLTLEATRLAHDKDILPINSNGGDRKTEQGISTLYYNTAERGTSQLYLVRRLKRDAPEIVEH